MRILIVSDTHSRHENLKIAVKEAGPYDLMLHLGDLEATEEELSRIAGCPVEAVAGNTDYFSKLPKEKIIDLKGRRFFLTHGHYYQVSVTRDYLTEEARDQGAAIALFGHTHIPYMKKKKGILVINPGSLTHPRQEGRKPTYAVMELRYGKEPSVEFFEINK